MSTSPPPRKRRKEARPSELTAAALGLFVEKGYAATRLEDVAQRAGVSKGTLYLYFDSKEALFKSVIQEGVVPVLVEAENIALHHEGSTFTLLEKLLANWWSGIGETAFAGIPKLMVAEASNFPELAQFYHENVIRRGKALLGSALERGVSSGEFAPMDIAATIEVVLAPILMLVIWRYSLAGCQANPVDPKHYLAAHLKLLRTGLVATRV